MTTVRGAVSTSSSIVIVSPGPTPAASWIDFSTPRQYVPSPIGIREPRYGRPAMTAWILGIPRSFSLPATSGGTGTSVPPPPRGVGVSLPRKVTIAARNYPGAVEPLGNGLGEGPGAYAANEGADEMIPPSELVPG